MKIKRFFLPLLSLSLAGQVFGQDKLLDRKGDEYLVKVLEISPDSIYYRSFADSLTATTYVIPKAAVFMITYQNGSKDVFQENVPEAVPATALSSTALYNLGRQDALKYFKPKGAYWGTLGSTLLYPPVGIGVGAAISLTPPTSHNVIASDPELPKNSHYMDGYNRQAKKQKLGKAAAGFGTAVGVYVAFVILVVAAWAY